MVKSFSNKARRGTLALFFPSTSLRAGLGLLIVVCCSCGVKESETGRAIDTGNKPVAVETKPEIVQSKPKEAPVVEESVEPDVVAKIGDYVITKQELEKRLMKELHPRYKDNSGEAEPVDAKTALMKMIAEKAMVIDAREQKYMEREAVQAQVDRFKQAGLIRLVLQRYLQGKVEVTDSEIDERVKANPKLKRSRAKALIEKVKANKLIDEYYDDLCKKLHVQKVSDNFPKAAEIHQRLLLLLEEPREAGFIHVSQVRRELTPEEKSLVLATFDQGKVTLEDWFGILCEMSPPSRPGDLHTPEGVERLLNRALRNPVFLAEARLIGFGKDENFLKQVKEYEDKRLFNEIRNEKVKDIIAPKDEEQIIACFNENKEAFGTRKKLKIDQIWCQDRNTAEKVKAELDSGKDFESVRQRYSLEKKGSPFNTSPGGEGLFFKDLWKGEPNEIVGPVKGFYRDGVEWRIVKILGKKPGEVKEYSSGMRKRVKQRMQGEQRMEALRRYQKELLEKYPYEIYADRIKDIDPLNIP